MNSAPKYSVIVPVYNRPEEVNELLDSLIQQTYNSFEVIIVEDGSTITCEHVVRHYENVLNIRYLTKVNQGPGPARNYGFQHATGQYFVVFDSDCIIPSTYFEAVEQGLNVHQYDAWGGPDKAHSKFTLLQRAMGYTMASVLTTGGIRGGKKRVGWFQPRSFNMGISRAVFNATGGFKFDRFAEDIEFSIRMKNAGFKVGLIEEAYVFHKRRSTFGQFFTQVSNFGKGRVLVGSAYPKEVKLTHWFPTVFMFAVVFLVLSPIVSTYLFLIGAVLFSMYLLAIFFHSLIVNRSVLVALLSIPSALLQLIGYGSGFFNEWIKRFFGKKK